MQSEVRKKLRHEEKEKMIEVFDLTPKKAETLITTSSEFWAGEIFELALDTNNREAHQAIFAALSECRESLLGVVRLLTLMKSATEDGFPHLKHYIRLELANYVKETFSLSLGELEGDWESKKNPDELVENIEKMMEIEKAVSGGVRRLHDNYGISEFIRYPTELLVAQLNEEEVQQPYGVVVYPRADHNDAFDRPGLFGSLREETKGRHGIKIFEAGNLLDLGRDLVRLDKKYGEKNKIDFMILGGHGSKDSIQFGGEGWLSHFQQLHLAGSGVRNAKRFFSPDSTVVLVSCSTGKEDGIGENIAETFNAKVIAPQETVAVRNLHITYDGSGKPLFDVDYVDATGKESPASIFEGGRKTEA